MHKNIHVLLLLLSINIHTFTYGFSNNQAEQTQTESSSTNELIHQPDLITTLTLAELYENLQRINEDLEKRIDLLSSRSDQKEIVKMLKARQQEIMKKLDLIDGLAQYPEIIERLNGQKKNSSKWLFWTILAVTSSLTATTLFLASYDIKTNTWHTPNKDHIKDNYHALIDKFSTWFSEKNNHSNRSQTEPENSNINEDEKKNIESDNEHNNGTLDILEEEKSDDETTEPHLDKDTSDGNTIPDNTLEEIPHQDENRDGYLDSFLGWAFDFLPKGEG